MSVWGFLCARCGNYQNFNISTIQVMDIQGTGMQGMCMEPLMADIMADIMADMAIHMVDMLEYIQCLQFIQYSRSTKLSTTKLVNTIYTVLAKFILAYFQI